MRRALPILALVAAAAACAPGLLATNRPGYLSGAAAPDLARRLPPPPAAGSAADAADRALFRRTRALEGTARWTLAQGDVHQDRILGRFSCAVGAELTPQSAPRTAALLKRLRRDVRQAVSAGKDHYRKPRPYLVEAGPICSLRIPGALASPDYPSGHASFGWSAGLVLAEAVPERGEAILQRARAFGESRIVCGVHSRSAVRAGEANARTVVAALQASADFRRDLEAARAELAAARLAAPTDTAACAREAALIAQPLD